MWSQALSSQMWPASQQFVHHDVGYSQSLRTRPGLSLDENRPEVFVPFHSGVKYADVYEHAKTLQYEFWRAITVFMNNLIDHKTLCPYVPQFKRDTCHNSYKLFILDIFVVRFLVRISFSLTTSVEIHRYTIRTEKLS